jgi:hypothetical protein
VVSVSVESFAGIFEANLNKFESALTRRQADVGKPVKNLKFVASAAAACAVVFTTFWCSSTATT